MVDSVTELTTPVEPRLEVADARPPTFSDDALAQRFVERYGDDLRYIAAWSHWYEWTSARWTLESTLHVFDLVRPICRIAASEAKKLGTKNRLTSATTVAAVERLAKVDRRIAATIEQWETDPDIFNNEEPTR
ncbi:MAG: hypothetical protein IID48_11065 [Proteobacteria bacterium]|nr:hypothetical protein [Pseudomonadota bacterium]